MGKIRLETYKLDPSPKPAAGFQRLVRGAALTHWGYSPVALHKSGKPT
jgi:hypothetical protein